MPMGDTMLGESAAHGSQDQMGEATMMGAQRAAQAGLVPACAVLSPPARVVLGCLEILDVPTVDALVEVTGLSNAEVRRCISELHAIGEAAATRSRS